MKEVQIIEKIKKILEEEESLDLESCYFITKKINEEYWEDIRDSEEEEIEGEEGEAEEVDGDVLDEDTTEEAAKEEKDQEEGGE